MSDSIPGYSGPILPSDPSLLADLRGMTGFDQVGRSAHRAAEAIEALMAELAALKEERAWRPIESADKTRHRPVLAMDRFGKHHIVFWGHYANAWRRACGDVIDDELLYFMPLPPAPEAQ